MLHEVSLFRLMVFKEVVESKGFRAASERLNISQPAISSHIRELEKQLGIVLLERDRQCSLTEAGSLLYDYARRVLKEAEDIGRVIAEMRSARRGRVIVGASATLGRYVVPKLMGEFKKCNPAVELVLRTGTTPAICEMLIDREIDFGFVVGRQMMPGLVAQALAHEELVIVVGEGHPLLTRRGVSADEVSCFPFVTAIKGSAHDDMVENALLTKGIVIRERVMQLEDGDSIKRVLEEGLGVGVLLRSSVERELQAGRLGIVDLDGEPMRVELRLLSRADKHLTPVLASFLNLFRQRIDAVLSYAS